MHHPRRLARAMLVGLTVAVIGCGGPSGSPSIVPSPSPAPVASPSAAAASPSGPTTSRAPAQLPHGAPALEARLPTQVRDTTPFRFSFAAEDLQGNDASATLADVVEQAGGDPATIEFAVANDAAQGSFNIIAIRSDGVDGAKLLDAYVAAAIASGDSLGSSPATIGGRDLVRLDNPATNIVGDLWLYADGDTVYGVQAADEDLVEEILTLLP